jgi:hypothetical protein
MGFVPLSARTGNTVPDSWPRGFSCTQHSSDQGKWVSPSGMALEKSIPRCELSGEVSSDGHGRMSGTCAATEQRC